MYSPPGCPKATLDNLQRNYQYDQLNRLKKTDYMKVNNDINHLVVAMASATAFRNAYIYDNDGSIKTLTRKNVSGVNIDSLTYTYGNPTANNKLDFVKDVAANTGGTDLPTGQLTGNYVYDAIGNLTKDVQGGINVVRWNLYGKVTDIEMNTGNKVIHYDYDGTGNRVRKDVSVLDVNGNGKRESDLYVRDAGGNILAVYKSNMGISGGLTIELINQSIADQHGSWTTPTGTGLTPFIVSEYGPNGQFSVPLIHEATSLNPTWSNSQSASLSLSQYLQLLDGIYAQATAEPLADYYNPMVTTDVTIMTQTLYQGNQAAFMPLFMALLTDTKYAVKYGTLTHLCQQTPSLAQAMLTMLGQPVSGSYVTNATTMYNLITATGPNNLMNAYQSKVGQFTPMPFYTVLCQDATILNKPWFVANPTIATGLGEGVYNSAPREEASTFFGGYLPGTWLASHSNLEERLNIVYNNNRGLFLDSYLTTIGVNALNSALHSIPQLTIGAYLQSVLQAVLIGTLNPTYQPPDVNTPDPGNITADTLYLAEHHLYGSSRLGIKTYDKGQYRAIYSGILPAGIRDSSLNIQRVWYSGGFADWIKKDKTVPYNGTVFNISLDSFREVRRLGSKQYELTDHLGNVLATVQDRKSGYGSASGSYVGFNANLASISDYYPGGFGMPGRNKTFEWYRQGFSGKEKDDELYGSGNWADFGGRGLDTRLMIWRTPDKLASKYPNVTPYAYVRNNPIWRFDPDGNTDYTATVTLSKNKTGPITKTVTVDIVYAIVDLSSRGVYNSSQVVGDAYNVEQFSTSFGGTDQKGKTVNVNVTTNVHYRLVTSINDVRDNENVMFVTNTLEKGPGEKGVDPAGLGLVDGNVMAIEQDYTSGLSVLRHEQGHNLGFNFEDNSGDPSHSRNGYMNAHGATKKNERIDKTPPGVLKKVFQHFIYSNAGVYKMGRHGTSRQQAKRFFNTTEMTYDKAKAKKAGVE